MKILVDLDGIIVDTLPFWLDHIHRRTGILATPDDITKWNLHDNPPLTKLKLNQILDILNEKSFNLNIPPMANVSFYLEKLHKAGHDISIVTARYGTNCMPETLEWLHKTMPWFDVEKKTWFCYDKHRITGDILIDDRAENLIKYREAHPNAKLITINYQYNNHAPPDTFRVSKDGHEWEQIESHINQLAKESK